MSSIGGSTPRDEKAHSIRIAKAALVMSYSVSRCGAEAGPRPPEPTVSPMRHVHALLLLSLAACGGSSSSTGPNGNTNGANGTFTATIDGAPWVSSSNQTAGGSTAANAVPGVVTLTGTKIVSSTNYTSISLLLGYLSGPGTYPLGVNQGTTAGGAGIVSTASGATFSTWSTNLTGSAGTVTITSLTSTRIGGTFQFTAPPQSFTTTTGTRVVTNGAFDLPLPANFTLAPASNKGSKVTGTIGGVAWNAASTVALGGNGVFGIAANTDSLSVSLVTGRPVSAGSSYPIGGTQGGIQGATLQVIKTGTAISWNVGTGTSPVGTLTIATLSGNRATGTIVATLVGGTALAVNVTFDIRIDPL